MATKVKPIPEGFHTVTPLLTVQGSAKLIDFLKQAFDAKKIYLLNGPNGTVMHDELKIGDSMVIAGKTTEQRKLMLETVALCVEDMDGWYQQARGAEASSVRKPSDQFYGDRGAGVKDFAGNHWWIHAHIEDVPPEEIKTRAEVWMKQQKCSWVPSAVERQ